MKIIKQTVNAKSRILDAKWTMEDIETRYSKMLADEIQKEIDNQIMRELLMSTGWHRIILSEEIIIPKEWCKENIRDHYRNFANYWYFVNSKDAAFFALKWS